MPTESPESHAAEMAVVCSTSCERRAAIAKRVILTCAGSLAVMLLLLAAWAPSPTVGLSVGSGALLFTNLVAAAACFVAAYRCRGPERAAFGCLTAILGLWAVARLAWLPELIRTGDAAAGSTIKAVLIGTALLGAVTFVLFYRHHRERAGWDGPIDAGIAALAVAAIMATIVNAGRPVDVDTDNFPATLRIGLVSGLMVGLVGMLMWRRSNVHCWLRWGLAGTLLLTAQVFLNFLAGPPPRHFELRMVVMAIGVASSACLAVMALRRLEVGDRPPVTTRLTLKARPLVVRITPSLAMLCAVSVLVWDQGILGYFVIAAVALVLVRGIGTLLTVESLLDERNRWAITDSLTGVFNRRHLEHELPVLAARAQRAGDPLTAIIFDLDGFKGVNDSHGHVEGDLLLRDVVAAVDTELRAGDALFRIGGDEFFILAPATGVQAGVALAERVRAQVSDAAARALPDGPPVTASIGVVAVPHMPRTQNVLADADAALYAAKHNGRNRVIVADGSP